MASRRRAFRRRDVCACAVWRFRWPLALWSGGHAQVGLRPEVHVFNMFLKSFVLWGDQESVAKAVGIVMMLLAHRKDSASTEAIYTRVIKDGSVAGHRCDERAHRCRVVRAILHRVPAAPSPPCVRRAPNEHGVGYLHAYGDAGGGLVPESSWHITTWTMTIIMTGFLGLLKGENDRTMHVYDKMIERRTRSTYGALSWRMDKKGGAELTLPALVVLCPVLEVQLYGPFHSEAESRVPPQVVVVASPNDHTAIKSGSSITDAYADAALKGPGHDKNPSSVPGFALRIVKRTVSFTIARSTSQTTSSSSRSPRQGRHREKVRYCSKHASATSANLAAGLRYAPRGNGSNQPWSCQVPSSIPACHAPATV
ncbi:hypothetical protein DFH08DRAFT_1027010 [Mycena albidolilacea]|uniref:Uncharacterized protein n=1 Tax=Mycena albidolilacea TaxID=1033008 RepID=A0AAD7EIA5_9AGAR|nr:hypothetical protein DFH08DRAFT_1027010 [Mycena albidolilacea]